ncbi:MAG: outer membrane lipoprotein chaperone LolA [Myxococcota bacterium]
MLLALVLTAAEVLARMQAAYDATDDLKASFKQTWENPAYGQTRVAYGYVYLRKPGRMRWNYLKPDKKSLVSDGKTLWVYEEEDAQIFRQDVRDAGMPAAVAFLGGGRKLADDFDATIDAASTLGGPGRIVVKLAPKVPTAQFRNLVFVVDDVEFLVRESVVVDHQGAENHLAFTGIERNTRIPDAKFRFVPPAGVPVLDPKSVLPQAP